MSSLRFAFLSAVLLSARGAIAAPVCSYSNTTVSLGGFIDCSGQAFTLTKATVVVPAFNGTDRVSTGNLVIRADSIAIDKDSKILAKGSGYQGTLCRDGNGPSSQPLSGGRGGCAVQDSGGGGAHFGSGGRGTEDNPTAGGHTYPWGYEEDCGDAISSTMTNKCADYTDCRNHDGLPTVAGQGYYHDIWATEFGAAGGDKGCRDGDGFDILAAGSGGGRIVLAAVKPPTNSGSLVVDGIIRADGNRGCGAENDSGGGGGGGTVLLVGDNVTVNATAIVSAKAGRGGDEQPKCFSCTQNSDCGASQSCVNGRCAPCNCTPCTNVGTQDNCATGYTCTNLGGDLKKVCVDGTGACAAFDATDNEDECKGKQNSGTCDDCGGGGGGGIINVKSRTKATIDTAATFNVSGAVGGICPVCAGEAGGNAGEIQLDGAYVGELCDGYDNDFDGTVDDNLSNVSCGVAGGSATCQTSISACTAAGVPTSCMPPDNTMNSVCECRGSSRPRISLLVDTSSSMLQDLSGTVTFGDGSQTLPGIDTNGNGKADDSKIFYAKNAVGQVIASYPEIDFALARYHQDEGFQRSCQTAKWLDCQNICCSYDNPNNEIATSPTACTLKLATTNSMGNPTTTSLTVHSDSTLASRCVNYAGTCGSPRRGADVLVGFESPIQHYMSWLDSGETNFQASTVQGDYCEGPSGIGDCELRAAGPTPIAESLRALYDYITPYLACDPAAACRGYSVIFVSDGAEECGGDPVAAAAELFAKNIKVYVIGVSVSPAQQTVLDAIAAAGGTTKSVSVTNQSQLVPALVTIVSSSIHTELCNGVDDNCNGIVDEGFNVGAACDNGQIGICKGTGTLKCATTTTTSCNITTPGATASTETCNGIDDNCNGLTDEGNPGGGQPCGSNAGTCKKGVTKCQGGALACVGATGGSTETCNGLDDDCDGIVDDCVTGTPNSCGGGACGSAIGECKPGTYVCTAGVLDCQGETLPTGETCNGKDDDCDGTIDDNVPGTGVACTTATDGSPLCKPGIVRCLNGALVCQGGVAYHPPTCTCPPDECAVTGDGGVSTDGCPGGSACIDCACRTPCAGGEFPCSGNQVCRQGFCVPPTCGGVLCQTGQDCVNDTCVDHCTQITCDSPLVCNKGQCVSNDCYGLGCAPGQVCQNSACVPDPCASVTCGDGEFCSQGTCTKTCEWVYCVAGQTCQNGACIAAPCKGLCSSDQTCTDGVCIDNACSGCEMGQVCKGKTCVDDPCAGITCPGDPALVRCIDGQCQPYTPVPAPDTPEKVVGAGGGGFSCSYAAGSAPAPRAPLWMLIGVVPFVLRRKKVRA